MHYEKFNHNFHPLKIQLAVQYKNIQACFVHHTKNCLALSMLENALTILFLSDTAAEDIKFTSFLEVHGHSLFSFPAGNDDFNFLIVTNLSINL